MAGCGCATVILLACGAGAADEPAKANTAAKIPPLTVGKGGAVLRDGKPYRGIGINYFSAFSRTLADPADTTYRQGFDELVKHGIPFIRFMAGGFWPRDWTRYQTDKEAYFRLMDAFVRAAEEKGIGLIPSLCWYNACIPDMVDEPRNQWGNPGSKTIAFMRQYVGQVVSRYANSPAIWAWELGNEYSLDADLPNAAEHRPWVHSDLGTRKERSADDDLTHDMVVTACREFGGEVRRHDALRPITTGHSLPRSAAHHLRTEKSWSADTKEQFAANLIDVTPDPLNLISVHVYPFDKKGRFGQDATSYAAILGLCMETAAKAGKPLFIGEFGASDGEKDGGPEAARKDNLEMIAAIESSGVPLAALWVFDLADQDSFINVTPTNHRSYLLDELGRANQRLSQRP
jgi:hypothetical protein